ncbi:MAG: CsbD family protein [Thermoleophilia bacterium]|nr:CsbD family protein [Thermoleophilia bacterium]
MTDKNVDEAKGRAKEAAGAATDDNGLKREGKADQARSSVKSAVDRAAETAKSLFGRKRK